MIEDLMASWGPARVLGTEQILFSCLMAFILCTVVAAVYRMTHQGLSYSRSFVHALILGGVITSILIMAIGNNLARGLGILGTLALIRFRTQIREPRDTIFLFAALATGIACGAAVFPVAIIGTLFFCVVAVFLHWSPFASRREYEGLLRFVMPAGAQDDSTVRSIMSACCQSFQLIAMREGAQGDLLEYSYHVRLLDPSYQSDLVNGLRMVEGVSEASLLMHRSTVEL